MGGHLSHMMSGESSYLIMKVYLFYLSDLPRAVMIEKDLSWGGIDIGYKGRSVVLEEKIELAQPYFVTPTL